MVRAQPITSLATFLILGYLIGTLFHATNFEILLFMLVFAFLSFIPNASMSTVGISFFVSISTIGFFVYSPFFRSTLFERYPQLVVLLVSVIFLLAFPLINKVVFNVMNSIKYEIALVIDLISLLAIAPFSFFYSHGDDRLALNILVNTGEDNAAWIESISAGTLAVPQAGYTTVYNDSSGEPFGVLLNFVHNIFLLMNESKALITDSPRILMITYGLVLIMGILAVFTSLLLVFESRQGNPIFTILFSIPLFSAIYFGWANFSFLGHFPAALAFFLILSSLSFSMLVEKCKSDWFATCALVITGIMLFAAGLTWFPITPVAFVTLASVLVIGSLRFLRTGPSMAKHFKLITLIACIFFVIFLLKGLYEFASNTTWSDLNFLIHAQGATVDPFGWPIIFALMGLTMITTKSNFNVIPISNLVSVFLIIFASYTLLVTLLSIVTQPFQADYAAKKLALLLTSIGLVFAIFVVGSALSSFDLQSAPMVLSLITLTAGAFFLFPGPKYTYPISIMNNAVPWVSSGLNQIQIHPERPVVCLNTSSGVNAASFDVYVCNRILGALQSSTKEDIPFWAGLSLQENWIPTPAYEYKEFQKYGITVLVTDETRMSTDNASQKTFLENVPSEILYYVPM